MIIRTLRSSCLGALVWLNGEAALHACPVCFRFDDASTAGAVQAAVFVLAAVTVGVLVPCGVFAVRLARQSAQETALQARDVHR